MSSQGDDDQLAEKLHDAALYEEHGPLIEEVADLVEAPLSILGSFEERFLNLPQPILTAVMKKHQRYFPVMAQPVEGESARSLLPRFVTIANADRLTLS